MQGILTFYQQKIMQKITVFAYVVSIYLTSWSLNDGVKLTNFEQLAPADQKCMRVWMGGPVIH